MRVEVSLNEPEAGDVAIDIGQVMAANQALLKNMARKMETMENKLHNMENLFMEQARMQAKEHNGMLLLTAPVKEVKPWQPTVEEVDENYYRKFSLFDRVFRPWLMRRQ